MQTTSAPSRWVAYVSLALVACFVGACSDSKKSANKGAASETAEEKRAHGEGKTASVSQVVYDFAGIPESSMLVAGLSTANTLGDLSTMAFLGDSLSQDAASALQTELTEYLEQELGMNLMALTSVTVFALPPADGDEPSAAAILRNVSGSPKVKHKFQHQNTDVFQLDSNVFAAVRDEVLVLGDEVGLKTALDVFAGKAPALQKDSALGGAAYANQGAYFFAAANVAAIPKLPPIVASYELSTARVAWQRDGLVAEVRGKPEGLKELDSMIRASLDGAVAVADVSKRSAKLSGKVPEAVGAIYGAHHLRHYAKLVQPSLSGDKLSFEVKLSPKSSAALPMMLGIGAAVAIPAWVKYRNNVVRGGILPEQSEQPQPKARR